MRCAAHRSSSGRTAPSSPYSPGCCIAFRKPVDGRSRAGTGQATRRSGKLIDDHWLLLPLAHDHAKPDGRRPSRCRHARLRREVKAASRPAIFGREQKAAPTRNAICGAVLIRELVFRVVSVLAPLKHIAVHVEQSPGIWRITSDCRRASQGRPLGCIAVGVIAVEIRLLRRQGVPVMERCVCPSYSAPHSVPLRELPVPAIQPRHFVSEVPPG